MSAPRTQRHANGPAPGVEDRLARPPPATQDERWFGRIRADFRAHGSRWGAQGFWALAVYRFGRWRYGIRAPLIRKPLSALYHVLFKLVQVATGIELPCEVHIGRNFVIDHFGGIIVSGYASFGDDCRIRQGVTVGLARTDDPCAPTIGHGVDIGAGAKLLGRIVIGNHVSIGANAVVVTDVPSHCIAIGVPAVTRPRHALRSSGRISYRVRRPQRRGVSDQWKRCRIRCTTGASMMLITAMKARPE